LFRIENLAVVQATDGAQRIEDYGGCERFVQLVLPE